MKVKFLKAGRGDAILLSSEGKNMLIDGGDDTTYLFRELDKIKSKDECIDYLVITHHDSDHIKGIIDFLEELKTGRFGNSNEFIKRIFFNSPRLISGKSFPKNSKFLSYKQANKIEHLISELDLVCDSKLVDNSSEIKLGQFFISCLSPNDQILEKYLDKTPNQYLAKNTSGDWNKDLDYLDKYINDKSLDRSIPNETSIVLLIKYEGKKGILTGDVNPKRLEIIMKELFERNKNQPVKLEFFKLPHHGSFRSISKGIIEKIECQNYIISTNGRNNYLPNKKALLKILKYQIESKSNINFIFNYPQTSEYLRISDKEKDKYKFSVITNNKDYGYSL